MKNAAHSRFLVILALSSALLSGCGFTLVGSSGSFSSTESVASSTALSSSSAPSASFSTLPSYDFRIAEAYLPSAPTAPVYAIEKVGDSYRGTLAQTLTRGQECLNYEDVAAYFAAFKDIPKNYFGTEEEAMAYGKNGRIVSTYYSGSYHRYDYTVKLGTYNVSSGGIYYEFDIDLTGNYNTGTYINRGAGRVVTIVDGISDYGADCVSYYTEDHYADFKEYYNFYKGWSPLFAGVYNKSGTYENSPKTTLSRPSVPTVSYTLA